MIKPIVNFKELKNGNTVVCPECKKGILKSDSNSKTSHFYKCNKCSFHINFD